MRLRHSLFTISFQAQIDEVETKVRDSEQKVLLAEQLAKEAEQNPLTEEKVGSYCIDSYSMSYTKSSV